MSLNAPRSNLTLVSSSEETDCVYADIFLFGTQHYAVLDPVTHRVGEVHFRTISMEIDAALVPFVECDNQVFKQVLPLSCKPPAKMEKSATESKLQKRRSTKPRPKSAHFSQSVPKLPTVEGLHADKPKDTALASPTKIPTLQVPNNKSLDPPSGPPSPLYAGDDEADIVDHAAVRRRSSLPRVELPDPISASQAEVDHTEAPRRAMLGRKRSNTIPGQIAESEAQRAEYDKFLNEHELRADDGEQIALQTVLCNNIIAMKAVMERFKFEQIVLRRLRYIACASESVPVLRLLINQMPAHSASRYLHKEGPILVAIAAYCGRTSVLEFLIDEKHVPYPKDIKYKHATEQNAEDFACAVNGVSNTVRRGSLLVMAMGSGHLKAVDFLFRHGCLPSKLEAKKIIQIAAATKCKEIVQWVLDHSSTLEARRVESSPASHDEHSAPATQHSGTTTITA